MLRSLVGSEMCIRDSSNTEPSIVSPFKPGFDVDAAADDASTSRTTITTSTLSPQERQRRDVEEVLRMIALDQVASVAQQEEMDYQKGFPFVARRPLDEALRNINLSNDIQFVDAIKKERAAGDLRSAEQEKVRNDARREANVRAHELARECVMARIRLGDLERDAQKDKNVAARIVLTAVLKGYSVRKKLALRRTNRVKLQQRQDLLDFMAAEQEDRRDIIGYEQAETKNLLEAHMAVQGLIRDWRDRRRRANEEVKVLNAKLRQLQVEEERGRTKIAADATQYWAQLARTYRKLRNSSVRVVPPPPGAIAQDDDDEENSTQTRRTKEFGGPAPPRTSNTNSKNSTVVTTTNVDGGLEGFPLDQTAVFITEYEAHLRDFRSRLVEDQRGLLDQYNKVMAMRDKLSYDMSPPQPANGSRVLEPKRPTTVDATINQNGGGGRLAANGGGGGSTAAAAGGNGFRTGRYSTNHSSGPTPSGAAATARRPLPCLLYTSPSPRDS
eukprot:TRINITY_DN48905_c0_g1_i1.p1 TRINITY_DN48905_c0_g1~~TRINITY_DN48905_c0_g1_i1.p1  ORF type:complete len:500 (-),score=124.02 TRINITY_DN48905_c0_g1_i1:108-1607(-)